MGSGSRIGVGGDCAFDDLVDLWPAVFLEAAKCVQCLLFEFLHSHVFLYWGYEVLDMGVEMGSDFVRQKPQYFKRIEANGFIGRAQSSPQRPY